MPYEPVSAGRHKEAGSDEITLTAADRNCTASFLTAAIKPYKNDLKRERLLRLSVPEGHSLHGKIRSAPKCQTL